MKVAIVYDRVNKWGGAERVLLALNEIFPHAPLYTSLYNKETASWAKIFPQIKTSFLQKLPFARDRHEHFPYLMPLAFESFNFSRFDLVISVTSEAAKGIITKPGTTHICFMLTPTRYLWNMYDFYFKGRFFKAITKPIVSYLRGWDRIAAQRPDIIVAQSTVVKKRIKKYYGRESELIFSPVDVEKFKISPHTMHHTPYTKDFFLYVSRLIPYKRADLAIEAFNELGFPLIIVGIGSEEKKLKKTAENNVKFVGELTDRELAGYYQNARALIFPQEEDFGLVVLEANAAGTPVIAYKAGGALDTVVDPVKAELTGQAATGIYFDKQDVKCLIAAIKRFEKMKFDKCDLIKNAERFSKERFTKEFKNLIEDVKR
jgi:glycosyltransferase involved in cell wall biosynthesis